MNTNRIIRHLLIQYSAFVLFIGQWTTTTSTLTVRVRVSERNGTRVVPSRRIAFSHSDFMSAVRFICRTTRYVLPITSPTTSAFAFHRIALSNSILNLERKNTSKNDGRVIKLFSLLSLDTFSRYWILDFHDENNHNNNSNNRKVSARNFPKFFFPQR